MKKTLLFIAITAFVLLELWAMTDIKFIYIQYLFYASVLIIFAAQPSKKTEEQAKKYVNRLENGFDTSLSSL